MIKRTVQAYHRSAEIRDRIFRPLAKLLTNMRITADMVTFARVVCLIFFVIFVRTNPMISAVFILLGILMDMLDGVLARHQQSNSDKGKFKDMVADSINFTLFTVGLAYADLINVFIGIIIVYFMVLSKLFRVIVNHFYFESGWYFKSVAGFLPNFIVTWCYIFYFILVLFNLNLFNFVLAFFSAILIIDSLIYFWKITKLKQGKKFRNKPA